MVPDPAASALANVRIVLSHPSHPGNIGAAARAMKTMGLLQLVLINPRCFPHDEAQARASGAADVLENAKVCSSLSEALRGTVFVAGMTARRRDLAAPFAWARAGAAELIRQARQAQPSEGNAAAAPVALLFGTEKTGLSNEELEHCHLGITIPANPQYSSLNLAAAVQLMAYELRQAGLLPGALPQSGGRLASHEEVVGLHAHFERLALASGFLDSRQPKRLLPRLRRLFARAHLEHEEVSILRGFLSTLEKPKQRR